MYRVENVNFKRSSIQYETEMWKTFMCVHGDGERRHDKKEIQERKKIMEDENKL